MSSFEQKIAYEIGIKLAYQDYMEKTAYFGALKSLYNVGKWGLGFGKGTGALGTINRTLGSAAGFGAINTLSTTGFDANRIFSEEGARAFAGGALGGAVFSAAMPALGKATKLLNKSWASSARGLSGQARAQAKALDKAKRELAKTQRQLSKAGKNPSKALTQKNQELQNSYKESVKAYKALQRSEGVGRFSQFGQAIGRGYGTPLSVAAGLGGGMYLSGMVQGHHDSKIKSPIMNQNNVFNPVS